MTTKYEKFLISLNTSASNNVPTPEFELCNKFLEEDFKYYQIDTNLLNIDTFMLEQNIQQYNIENIIFFKSLIYYYIVYPDSTIRKTIINFFKEIFFLNISPKTLNSIELKEQDEILYNNFFPNDINVYLKLNNNKFNVYNERFRVRKYLPNIDSVFVFIEESTKNKILSVIENMVEIKTLNVKIIDFLIKPSNFFRQIFKVYIQKFLDIPCKAIINSDFKNMKYISFRFEDDNLEKFIDSNTNIPNTSSDIIGIVINIQNYVPFEKIFTYPSLEKYSDKFLFQMNDFQMLFKVILLEFLFRLQKNVTDTNIENNNNIIGSIVNLYHNIYNINLTLFDSRYDELLTKRFEQLKIEETKEEIPITITRKSSSDSHVSSNKSGGSRRKSNKSNSPSRPSRKKSNNFSDKVYPPVLRKNRFNRISKDIREMYEEYPKIKFFTYPLRDCVSNVKPLQKGYPTNSECDEMYKNSKNKQLSVEEQIQNKLQFTNECIDSRCWDEAHCKFLMGEAKENNLKIDDEYVFEKSGTTSIKKVCDTAKQNTELYGPMLYRKKVGLLYGVDITKSIKEGFKNIKYNLNVIIKNTHLPELLDYFDNIPNIEQLLEMYEEYITEIEKDTQEIRKGQEIIRPRVTDKKIIQEIPILLQMIQEAKIILNLGVEKEYEKITTKKKKSKKR